MPVTLTNVDSRPVVTGEGDTPQLGVAIAIDYTEYYDRIATALETIATNSTTIAAKISDIRNYQLAIKNWADSDGIHVKNPWDYIGLYTLIKLFEERGYDLATARSTVEATLKHRD